MACQFEKRRAEIRRNLRAVYRRATSADKLIGAAWYESAHRLMIQWSDTYGVSIATAACVTAAISPQCNWFRNTACAEDVLAGRPVGYGPIRANVEKAKRILVDRATDTLIYFPHGPKVWAFAQNLAGNARMVTVDTHAMQAAFDNVQADYRLKWQAYRIIAECYAQNAAALHVNACDYQSIIWHVWKRLHPTERKRVSRRQWIPIGELED